MKDKQQRSQSELETIIRNGKWGSQSDANTYLQQHGLSAQLKDDGTADIVDDSGQRVASVKFQGSDQSQRQISSINF